MSEGEVLPIEGSRIKRVLEAAAAVELEPQVAALKSQRGSDVVVEDVAVGDFQSADAQGIEFFARRFCRPRLSLTSPSRGPT